MKFFLDSANLAELKKAIEWGVIDGVTTNPSLIAKEGVPVEEQVRRICGIIDGDVSAEVVSTSAREIVEEGRRLAKIQRGAGIISGKGRRVYRESVHRAHR
jgi:transaldolase